MTGRLIVISGPTAAGKTTVGHALAELLPRAIHVDGDAIQRFVVTGSSPHPPPRPQAGSLLCPGRSSSCGCATGRLCPWRRSIAGPASTRW